MKQRYTTQLKFNVTSSRFYFLFHFQENKFVKTPMHTNGKRTTNFVSRTLISLYFEEGRILKLITPSQCGEKYGYLTYVICLKGRVSYLTVVLGGMVYLFVWWIGLKWVNVQFNYKEYVTAANDVRLPIPSYASTYAFSAPESGQPFICASQESLVVLEPK